VSLLVVAVVAQEAIDQLVVHQAPVAVVVAATMVEVVVALMEAVQDSEAHRLEVVPVVLPVADVLYPLNQAQPVV